jgi:hypothetical protein
MPLTYVAVHKLPADRPTIYQGHSDMMANMHILLKLNTHTRASALQKANSFTESLSVKHAAGK